MQMGEKVVHQLKLWDMSWVGTKKPNSACERRYEAGMSKYWRNVTCKNCLKKRDKIEKECLERLRKRNKK